MKTIKGNYPEMAYPVGDHIQENFIIIEKMGNCIKTILKENKIPKDTDINIICSGSSGAIIASIITAILIKTYENVYVRHIKKDGENSHSGNYIFKELCGFNIVVDDFIATGSTMHYIFEQLHTDTKIDLVAISGTTIITSKFFQKNKVKFLLESEY